MLQRATRRRTVFRAVKAAVVALSASHLRIGIDHVSAEPAQSGRPVAGSAVPDNAIGARAANVPQLYTVTPGFRPRAIIKFHDDDELPAGAVIPSLDGRDVAELPTLILPAMPTDFRQLFDEFIARLTAAGEVLALAPEFSCIDPITLSDLTNLARERNPNADLSDLSRYYRVVSTSDIARELAILMPQWTEVVELAYYDSAPVTPTIDPTDDVPPGDHRSAQGYSLCAPIGVDAHYATGTSITGEPGIPGGRGEGVAFALIDGGWWREHDDLPSPPADLVFGFERPDVVERKHGNASFGVVAARIDNDFGCDGISPAVTPKLLTQWETSGDDYLPCAIVRAILELHPSPPAVLLIEVQHDHRLPVEVNPACYAAIRLGTALDIAIVEPAGNGGVDLDDSSRSDHFYDANRRLHSSGRDFEDSGAIMVGGVKPSLPHELYSTLNRGRRIDCYAWGAGVATVGAVAEDGSAGWYMLNFAETSAASAIIAGVAASLRGVARTREISLSADELRSRLSDRELNTPVYSDASGASSSDICYHDGSPVYCNEADGCVGVMPDMRRIIDSIS